MMRRMIRHAAPLALLATLVLACSSTAKGTGSTTAAVQGAVRGASFTTAAAVATKLDATTHAIFLLDHPVACPFLQPGSSGGAVFAPNVMSIEIDVGSPLSAPGAGTYTVGATSGVSVITTVRQNDATCADNFTYDDTRAQSGVLTLSSVSDTMISGDVSFAFIGGDVVHGHFDAALCVPGLDAGPSSCGP
jgi:hypothetical protein